MSQSEEDKQLQEDLEMMVERLGVSIWYILKHFLNNSLCVSEIKSPPQS